MIIVNLFELIGFILVLMFLLLNIIVYAIGDNIRKKMLKYYKVGAYGYVSPQRVEEFKYKYKNSKEFRKSLRK
jgi:hypothetical protein